MTHQIKYQQIEPNTYRILILRFLLVIVLIISFFGTIIFTVLWIENLIICYLSIISVSIVYTLVYGKYIKYFGEVRE